MPSPGAAELDRHYCMPLFFLGIQTYSQLSRWSFGLWVTQIKLEQPKSFDCQHPSRGEEVTVTHWGVSSLLLTCTTFFFFGSLWPNIQASKPFNLALLQILIFFFFLKCFHCLGVTLASWCKLEGKSWWLSLNSMNAIRACNGLSKTKWHHFTGVLQLLQQLQ